MIYLTTEIIFCYQGGIEQGRIHGGGGDPGGQDPPPPFNSYSDLPFQNPVSAPVESIDVPVLSKLSTATDDKLENNTMMHAIECQNDSKESNNKSYTADLPSARTTNTERAARSPDGFMVLVRLAFDIDLLVCTFMS